MKIWRREFNLLNLNQQSQKTLVEWLNIQFVEIGENFLKATMPVDHRTHQPFGILHGGASVVLAETLGSVASHCCLDNDQSQPVGLEINANHIKSIRSGLVTGTCHPIHIGKSTHLWDIKIENEKSELICISRLTVAILPQKTNAN